MKIFLSLWVSRHDGLRNVIKRFDPSDKRPMAAAVLIIFGRLCFAIGTICLCTHFLFGQPPALLRIGVGLAAALLMLLLAAFLLRDFRWLWQMPVIGFAVAGLAMAGTMSRLYFIRQPHSLSSYEFGVGVAGLIAFAGSAVLLRRSRKV